MEREVHPQPEVLVDEFESKIATEARRYQGLPMAVSGGIDSGTLAHFIKPSFIVSVELPGGDKYDEGRYRRTIVKHLDVKHFDIVPNPDRFDEGTREAVKAIGRPIPHFNIYPLYVMYRELSHMGVKELVIGDGPDETMCGYARNLIMANLYKTREFDAFKPYTPLVDKILPPPYVAYAKLIGQDVEQVKGLMAGLPLIKGMNRVDMTLMRPDMDDMSNGIAKLFGITNIRPYQDNNWFDQWQYNLPDEAKIHNIEYGKYLLRLVAQRYLPYDLAWRKVKVGGPVWPVNLLKGWMDKGEFDKNRWMEWQRKILDERL